jgi:hypothetical protein
MKGRTMKWFTILILAIVIALTILAALPFASGHAEDEASPIFGVKIPAGYRDWRLISVAHEEGSLNDLRAILGNDVAIGAARPSSVLVLTVYASSPQRKLDVHRRPWT